MAETLGSLCDKLTVVKLKQYHAGRAKHHASLVSQEKQLQEEINEFIDAAISGEIPTERLSFAANKIYKKEGNKVAEITGSLGSILSRLAQVNCELWHQQEHVYEFEKVPVTQKDEVIKRLALLNLERNECIDKINYLFQTTVEAHRKAHS